MTRTTCVCCALLCASTAFAAQPAKEPPVDAPPAETKTSRKPLVTEVSAPGVTVPPPPPPFYRGSALVYRNVVAAVGLNPAAEPTHNPYYVMQLAIQPRAWLNKKVYARGSFDVIGELTQSDTTTDAFVISDVGLALGGSAIYTIPRAEVDVSVELTAALPTSKGSRASTRLLSNGAALMLARKFNKVSVSYTGSLEKYWNRYTTGSPTAQLFGVCEVSGGPGCVDMFVASGRRNASWATSHGLSLAYTAKPWLTVNASAGVSTAFLYALTDDPNISLRPEKTSDHRHTLVSSVGVSAKPTDELTVGIGVRSAHLQLAPQGGYRFPLLNRFTQLSLELGLNLANLVSRLRS